MFFPCVQVDFVANDWRNYINMIKLEWFDLRWVSPCVMVQIEVVSMLIRTYFLWWLFYRFFCLSRLGMKWLILVWCLRYRIFTCFRVGICSFKTCFSGLLVTWCVIVSSTFLSRWWRGFSPVTNFQTQIFNAPYYNCFWNRETRLELKMLINLKGDIIR